MSEFDPDLAADDAALDVGIGDDILAVDDNAANLVAIESALAPLGRRLVTASSGLEALAKLLDQDFAVILLDVQMPGMSGIETARMIRARERNRGTPIVFVTGMSWHDQAIDDAYEAGGFDFLVKPIRAEVLRAKIRVYLQLQERTRALKLKADELRESQRQLHDHELREQRKRFEAEVFETKLRQLDETQRERHDFVEILGHELRNPLQTLQVAFDLFVQGSQTEADRHIAHIVERRFAHVTRIVNDLLDVTRIATGQFELLREPVNFGDVVRRAVEDISAIVATRQLVLSFDVVGDADPVVTGDAMRLHQAISNMIDHAAMHTDAGGHIHVTLRVDPGEVVVRVADDGHGIPPELLPRVFDMFVRGRVGADGYGGLGLGLTFVKRLIELHDGAVLARSPGRGKGSVVEVRLPLAPEDIDLGTVQSSARPTYPMNALARPTESSES
ncbi:MAG: ATP-binding protein [Kofleriaceae bacterium]